MPQPDGAAVNAAISSSTHASARATFVHFMTFAGPCLGARAVALAIAVGVCAAPSNTARAAKKDPSSALSAEASTDAKAEAATGAQDAAKEDPSSDLSAEASSDAKAEAPAGAKKDLSSVAPAGAEEEIRALWVLRTSLTTPEHIATLVRSARDHGFNTLLVQVRGRGDAYYLGGREPRATELLRQPATFDPLASVLKAGHAAGLRVHAWVNVNLISSATDLPAAREHVVYRHAGWLMVPRDIAQELARLEPESPAYVGKLARWTRAQPNDVEGLYTSPIVPEAAAYTESVVRDLVRRYAVDGIHLDYARYPSDRFDYSRPAIRAFRAAVQESLPAAARRALDADAKDDVFAYPDRLPGEWRTFRIARMTALMMRLHATVKRERPQALVSVAVAPNMQDALRVRLQDWGAWLSAGLVDAICPMAYTTDASQFAEQIAAAREAAGTRAVWAGIGAYRLPPRETVENIRTARRLGADGVILFSYDSLIDPRQTPLDYLSAVARAAFTTTSPAAAGSR
jgi:uncharacterized lipoprotein YddW (UPF0748 family)